MQVTLNYVKRTPKTSQAGKPYTSLSIKTNEHGEKWLSGFGNKDNENWNTGDTVEIEVEQKGEYLNFSTPKGSFQRGGTAPDVNRVEAKIDALRAEIATLGGTLNGMRGVLGEILQKVAPATDEPF